MAINEETRQLEIACELESVARTLAHSTRDVPHPHESYALIGELRATVDHLNQVVSQLARWHKNAVKGKHYGSCDTGSFFAPEDGVDDDRRALIVEIDAAGSLEGAAEALQIVARELGSAHSANGTVGWYEVPKEQLPDNRYLHQC